MLDALDDLNQQTFHQDVGDPETHARIKQYEMAFRMQRSVPELVDFPTSLRHILDMYGPDVSPARHVRRQLSVGATNGRTRCAICPNISPRLGSTW